MVDSCEVRQPPTSGAMDPATGLPVVTTGALIYTGRFKIQSPSGTTDRVVESGGHQFVNATVPLHFPVSAPAIKEGHQVLCTQSPLDPHNAGRMFRVTGPSGKTMGTAQRCTAEEVVDS